MPICWKCGQETSARFCPSCGVIQPPAQDYFGFFELPPRLNLDTAELEKRFYALSRQLHPDLFSRKSEQEKAYSTDASAVLNDAYRTLRDPLRRAEYVLSQNGLVIGEQQSKNVPPELLEEVFELNMALEELRMGDAEAAAPLEAAARKFLAMQDEIDAELQTAFAAYDAALDQAKPNQAKLDPIRALLNRRRYIRNLVRDVETALAAKTTA